MQKVGLTDYRRAHAKTLVVGAIEDGLDRCVPDSGRIATIYFLEKKSLLRFSQIAEDPERFVSLMGDVFGIGASVLLDAIVAELESIKPENREEKRCVASFAQVLQEGSRSIEACIL